MKRTINSKFPLGAALLGLLFFATSWTMVPNNGPSLHPEKRMISFGGTRWQMVSFKLARPVDYDGDGKPDSDLIPFLQPCELDNTLAFESSGQLTTDSGKLQCNGRSQATRKAGTWLYADQTRTLRLVEGDTRRVREWEVIDSSESGFTVRVRSGAENPSMDVIITWKRA